MEQCTKNTKHNIKSYKIHIAYIILITCPFKLALFVLSFKNLPVSIILFLFYISLAIVLGILNIINSFRACAQKDIHYCLKSMLILKYGLIPFFVINFLEILFLLLIAIVASRGTIVIFGMFLIPIAIPITIIIISITWSFLLPGAFYGVNVVRLSIAENKITAIQAIVHCILQFCFVLDILDAMYLSVSKWNYGKKISAFIAALYIILIIIIVLYFILLFL